jgi:cell division protein FtsB
MEINSSTVTNHTTLLAYQIERGIEVLTIQISELQGKIRRLLEENKELKAKAGNLSNGLETNDDLVRMNKKLKDANESLEIANENLAEVNKNLSTKNEKLKGENEKLKDENEKLKGENEKLTAAMILVLQTKNENQV